MNPTDAALLESLAGRMSGQSISEMVRRYGDKVRPGINRPGFSTFTVTSAGGKEEEGTTFKARTSDGKMIPIIMRGQAGRAGTAEALVPRHGRVSLSIGQASMLRSVIGSYEASEVKSVIAAIKRGDELPEDIDPARDFELIEKAPPGWAGTVKAMKKHLSPERAFALAWSMYKKGAKPHYKDGGKGTNSKGEPEKKAQYKDEAVSRLTGRNVPNIPEGKSLVFRKLDMGNNESRSIAISREGDGTLTAMTFTRSKGGFRSVPGAQKWLEKQLGKKLHGGIVEDKLNEEAGVQEAEEDDDLTFVANPDQLQRDIEQKLGLAGMKSAQDVLKVISSMYSTSEVPAAVYAAASGMARAEQRVSVPLAKAMNQLSAADVAAAIRKGIEATKSPTIKNMERWWMDEIGSLAADRGGSQHTSNNVGIDNSDEVQPYIDFLATEEGIDGVFEQSVEQQGQDPLPIGSGALSGLDAIGTTDGFQRPNQMAGNDDLATEVDVDPASAAMLIKDGKPQSGQPASAMRHATALPGENRIRPGQYTAESIRNVGDLDDLDFATRLRLAEAYDRLLGDAPDMGQEEVVDAELYKALLRTRHSNPQGKTTPVAAPTGKTGAVVVNDLDTAFEASAGQEENAA